MDDVMRLMLERHSGERGFASRDVERAVTDVCACSVRALFDAHVRGAAPIDFDRWLGLAGLRVVTTPAPVLDREGRSAPDLRMWAWQPPSGGALQLVVTNPASSWGRAGLHSGDRLTSINGRSMRTWPEVRALLTSAHIGDTLRFEVARAAGAFRTSVVMRGYDRPVARIEALPSSTRRQRAVREGWLARAEPDRTASGRLVPTAR
jgi:predicted metalloprotease with PDZ domain